MKRPFAAIILAYAAGILLGYTLTVPVGFLFGGAFALLFLALLVANSRPFLLWPLIFLAGWSNFALRIEVRAPDDLRSRFGDEAALVTVYGHLAETPRLRISEVNERLIWHSVVPVLVDHVTVGEKDFASRDKIMVNTTGILNANYFTGQPVAISGVLALPRGPMAEGLFDYRAYLAMRGIFLELKANSTNDWKILEPSLTSPPLTDRFLNWSRKTLALGLPSEDEPLQLLWAMTLGWRTALTGDISDPFLRAGTMHMFAIDGLRIALLSGMIVGFLRVLRLSRGWCGIIAVPAIWFYTAATGWEPPAVRASVMMTIVLIGWALKRPGDLLNSLALAAFIILVQEPRQLFEAGFQLSFFVVLIISLMLPPLNALIDRFVRHDPLLPDLLVPWWQNALLKTLRWTARLAALSFTAWVGSVPLSAKYFHLFSPVSTLANLFAVPCGALALTANLASLLCGAWCPALAGIFNNAAWFFMVAMTRISEWATAIPGTYCYVPEPPAALIAIYYVALILLLGGWWRKLWGKIIGAGILTSLVVLGCGWWQTARTETKLTVLPLSGGHTVYVTGPGWHDDWLVDCGSTSAADYLLKPFLRAQGANHISHLILTEGDQKNCGGAEFVASQFPIRELATSGIKFRSPAYRNAVASFEKPPSHHKTLNLGAINDQWQVLHPDPASTAPRADGNALVLLGNFSGARVLLLSDLSREGQDALLARTNLDLHADIAIAGLPEKGEPLCDALLAAVHPRVIVIADSEMPAYRQAHAALKSRLKQSGVPVIYTRDSDAAAVIIRPDGWIVQAMDGTHIDSSNH